MVSSVWNGGWGYCRQTPPGGTIQPSCPARSCQGSEGLLHSVGLPLGLTIHLRVDDGQQGVIDTAVGAKSVPKLIGKFFAMIGGDIVPYASFTDHMLEENWCQLWTVNAISRWEVDGDDSQTVEEYQDPGVS